MPMGAVIISAGSQNMDDLCIWAEVDSENHLQEKTIHVVGTGWMPDVPLRLIGRADTRSGFVFHIYEEVMPES